MCNRMAYPLQMPKVSYSKKLNISSAFGFLLLLHQARRLLRHACAWYAVPCGTWVYMPFGSFWACSSKVPQAPKGQINDDPTKQMGACISPKGGLGIGCSFAKRFFL